MSAHRVRQPHRAGRTAGSPQMMLRLRSASRLQLDSADEQKLIFALAALLRNAAGQSADVATIGGAEDESEDPS